MTSPRKRARLAEQGRRLASTREDLIASGVDPADLVIPLHPDGAPSAPRRHDRGGTQLLRLLSRMWLLVAVSCLAAFSGCVSAAGAMLMVNNALTWHAWVAIAAGICWLVGMVAAAAYAGVLHRKARNTTPPTEETS